MGGAQSSPPLVGVVIVAAGRGRRMGGADKAFLTLAGKPMLAHAGDAFQGCPAVHRMVIVLARESVGRGWELARERGWSKVIRVCPGGERRQDSVLKGLKHLSDCQWVVIHDGARPCLSADLIEKSLAEAQRHGAAIAAVPVIDTIKVVGPEGLILETPKREALWAAQTPQAFRFDIIWDAYQGVAEEVTDDAVLLERKGYRVKVFLGSYDNIKVTTPEDLALAETILSRRKAGREAH